MRSGPPPQFNLGEPERLVSSRWQACKLRPSVILATDARRLHREVSFDALVRHGIHVHGAPPRAEVFDTIPADTIPAVTRTATRAATDPLRPIRCAFAARHHAEALLIPRMSAQGVHLRNRAKHDTLWLGTGSADVLGEPLLKYFFGRCTDGEPD